MNNYEKDMHDILVTLKEKYGVLAVKSEFEAEGATYEEIEHLSRIVKPIGLESYIKIGGCEAITDLRLCKELGADGVIAPMIESPFALKKFLSAINRVYNQDEQKKVKFIFNIETITGFNNLDSILSIEELDNISALIVGRSDFTASMGYDKKMVNSNEIVQYTRKILEKANEKHLEAGIGGSVVEETIPVLHSLGEILKKFETRKIVFQYSKDMDYRKAIKLALQFEIIYLENSMLLKRNNKEQKNNRIDYLKQHL